MVAAPANAVASSSASTLDAQSYPRYIDNGHVELYKPIGTGAYGVVFLGVDHSRGQPMYCAVKALRRTGLDDRQRKFQRREMGLHRLASNHPSICRMDRTIDEGDYTYVIMEWGEDGDLFAMITDKQRFVGDDNLIRDVFTQLVDGVEHLHSLGIAHRDIKPENIVCSEGGARVQICDFGLATSEQVSSEFGCGSTFYIAPECLGDWFEAKDYPTQSGDVWSLGVILVNLVCGRNPWRIASPQDESFNSFVADPHFLRRILPISTECLYVLTRIFTINPWERITLPELRHLVSQVGSFTMNEEELRYAHAAAQKGDESLVADTDGASFAAEHNEDEDEDEFDMDRTWSDRSQFRLDIPVDHVPDMDEDDDEDMYHRQARLDADTPPLAHSRSPSSPTGRSRSGSSMGGSLPPTPQLWAEDEPLVPATLPDHGKLAAPDVLAHLNLFRPQQADAAGYKPRVAHHGSSPLASPDFISGNVPLQYYA